jgi:2-haloacid dehalogenase
MLPALLTFDIFGTVIDWQEGLRAELAARGIPLDARLFDEVLADQERAEKSLVFQKYADIMAWSLAKRLGVPPPEALAIGRRIGTWPLFADARAALSDLLAKVPCVAMTNSDKIHGEQVEEQLGYRLSAWMCAEEVGVYKPAASFWHEVARRRGIAPDKNWWHVAAYADYDLATAHSLGLTTVFVKRPHGRSGPADVIVDDLRQLVSIILQK